VSDQVLVNLEGRHHVGDARRAAADLTRRMGFGATEAGTVALAVTEATTNIVKHAGAGKLLLRCLERAGVPGLEALALDRGPGIPDVPASLRDGTSTAGSSGTGLGALSRISHDMQIYSQPGEGTALRLEFWRTPPPTVAAAVQIGVVCVAKSGEPVPGDAWGVESDRGRYTLVVADGLGHGSDAARAARAATDIVLNQTARTLAELMSACHAALASTRGAAVGLARFSVESGGGTFAGIGNISARVESAQTRRQIVSHNGIVGHALHRIQEIAFDFPPGSVLILHSDGLSSRWSLAEYRGLVAKHPSLIAGVLYRDHHRVRDDVTVVVMKKGSGG